MRTYKVTMIVMGLALASLVASCKKNENNNGTASGKGFTALTEQDGNGRTYMDGVAVNWSTGDQIKVYNGAETRVFGLTEGENSTSGSFKTSNGQFYDYSGPFSAAYPSSQVTSMGDATASFSVPATQTFKSGSFGEGAMPMVAYSTDQTLAFKNLFGGLCFPLYGDNLTVKKVVLTTAADEALWGTFDVAISTSGGDPTLGAISNADATAKKSVTLDCGAGIQLGSTAASATEFYIMVPPGTLEAGFTVTAYNENNVAIFTKSTSTAPGTDFIQRNTVRKVNGGLKIETLNVTTISPTFITINSALGLGKVEEVPVKCGFVYTDEAHLGTPANDYFHFGESGVSSIEAVTNGTRFEASLASLTSDQVYYVRAWAENSMGQKYYGAPIPFATRYDYYSNINNGKGRGVFTVGDNTQVRFSMGNLQYIGSAGNGDANNTGAYWKFAENQYEILGNNGQGSADVAVDRDLFGWGTSGINDYSPIATCYQPWSTSVNSGDYNPYGSNTTSLSSNSGKADWGYNPISNGGNTSGQWRTMTGGSSSGEWYYLLFSRDVTYRFAKANLLLQGTSSSYVSQTYGHPACGTAKPGLILFPDSFSFSTIVRVLNCNGRKDSMSVNIVPEAEWSLLEQAGCIFLPTTGSRDGTTAQWFSSSGYYWSSSYYSPSYAYNLRFDADIYMTANVDRYYARAVRLVCDAN